MLKREGLLSRAVVAVALGLLTQGVVAAQTGPAPSPAPAAAASPSPSPSPTPIPAKKPKRLNLSIESYTSGVNQQFVGPGINNAPEIPSFKAGGPLAPAYPYDYFSGVPTTTGESISQDLIVRPSLRVTNDVDVAVGFGYGSIGGSGNVGAYWGGSLMPTFNPHLGSLAAPVTPFFATHNGQDPASATRISVLDGSIALHNGKGGISGGWIDLHQTVPFVFQQAPNPNTSSALSPIVPQTIGDGSAGLDIFRDPFPYEKLQGYEAFATVGNLTGEVSNANLPAPAGTLARESSFSGVYSAGQVKISAMVAHLVQSGAVNARVLFGGPPTGAYANINFDGAAVVPFSSVTGQRMYVDGFGATFPLLVADVDLRYANSCYGADNVAVASTSCTSGNYYFAKFHQGFAKFDLSLEFVRVEPTFAPALLPYGTVENVWSAPFAFPATWLAQDYHFANTGDVPQNRQGLRATTSFFVAGIETRIAIARYGQVLPYDLTTGTQAGFVDPYFSPQLTSTQGVRGTETHAQIWLGAHPKLLDISLELSDVITNRTAAAGRAGDAIAVDYPSAVLSLSRQFGRYVFGVGAARYGMEGSYDITGVKNVSLHQNILSSGLQYRSNANSAYGLEYQLFSVDGNSFVPGAASPAYHGPQIQFYQRLRT